MYCFLSPKNIEVVYLYSILRIGEIYDPIKNLSKYTSNKKLLSDDVTYHYQNSKFKILFYFLRFLKSLSLCHEI